MSLWVNAQGSFACLIVAAVLAGCGGSSPGADAAKDAAAGDAGSSAGTGGGADLDGEAGADATSVADLAPDVVEEADVRAVTDGGIETAPDVGGIGDTGATEGGSDADGGSAPLFALAGRYAGMAETFVCDVNGDGKLDVVTGDSDSSSPIVWLGHGDGTFDAAPVVTQGSATFAPGVRGSVEVGDFDGDHRCDLFLLGSTPVTGGFLINAAVAHGQTNGTFSTALPAATDRMSFVSRRSSQYVRTGATDADGDGIADVIFAGTNQTDGTYDFITVKGQPVGSAHELIYVSSFNGVVAPQVASVAGAADVDKDGIADILVGSQDGVYVVYGSGSGLFSLPRRDFVMLKGQARMLVDLDGDRLADPVVNLAPLGVPQQIYWTNVGGTFTAGPMGPFSQVGDFDADGKTDLIGDLVVVFGDGARGFGKMRRPKSLNIVRALVGDFDGDGATDIVAGATEAGAIYLSTAKHAAPATPDIHCGTLTPTQCAVPSGF